jgi:hypothetical protein
VNRHQQIALQNHCRLAGECINPLFGFDYIGVSICLTVNSGYE